MITASLSRSTSRSLRPLAASVLPVDTRSQMKSALPSLGAISTAPEKYSILASIALRSRKSLNNDT